MNLVRKTVIVTGASAGIGRATALAFARAGANVVVAARSAERLDALVSEMEGRYGIQGLAIPTDVTHEEQVSRLVKSAHERFGSVDVLINNAGRGMRSTVSGSPVEQMRRIFDLNVWGVLYGVQAAVPYMKQQGHGMILNVSSLGSYVPLPYSGAYVASKAALNSFGNVLRIELSGTGIQVSTVYPGFTESEFHDNIVTVEGQTIPQLNRGFQRLTVPAALVGLRMVQATQRDTLPQSIFINEWERLATLPVRLFDKPFEYMMRQFAERLRAETSYASR